MCGIAGMIDFTQDLRTQENICKEMQNAIIRRGPDQNGMFLAEHAALVHTRLSVIDPVSGIQPMSFTDPEQKEIYRIIYNGELYNTPELRKDLAAKGCQFRTNSDTEVILQAYAVYG
ncbi:MAG: asparagine synthetase B, partial [Oscillospiraceae bacterium]|nr:asparagine synthetase B [Oscillospiraceae bacterium]